MYILWYVVHYFGVISEYILRNAVRHKRYANGRSGQLVLELKIGLSSLLLVVEMQFRTRCNKQ